jgi:hypothetical protein
MHSDCEYKKQKDTVPELLTYLSRRNCAMLCTDPGILDLQVEKVGVVTGLSTRDFESNSFTLFWCDFTESVGQLGWESVACEFCFVLSLKRSACLFPVECSDK